MKQAAEDMGKADSFHGYGPEQGYDFLREKIQAYYAENSVALELSEIFVSDGAKSDLGNILDLFDKENTVLIPDPVYPVYVDTNLMDGRKSFLQLQTKTTDFFRCLMIRFWQILFISALPTTLQERFIIESS